MELDTRTIPRSDAIARSCRYLERREGAEGKRFETERTSWRRSSKMRSGPLSPLLSPLRSPLLSPLLSLCTCNSLRSLRACGACNCDDNDDAATHPFLLVQQSDFPDLRFGLAPDNTFPLRASDYVSCSKWGECVVKFQVTLAPYAISHARWVFRLLLTHFSAMGLDWRRRNGKGEF